MSRASTTWSLGERRPGARGPGSDLTSQADAPVRDGIDAVPGWANTATVVLVATSVVLGIAGLLTRGPWMDEFWTLWATDPGLSWGEAMRQRWLTDVHPPWFYLGSRLFGDLLGGDIAHRRLQNIVPLLGLLGFLAWAGRRWANARRFVLVCTVLTLSSYFVSGLISDYRSYFAQFCCGVVFYACGYALLCGDRILGPGQRRTAFGILWVTGLLLLNVHFVTSVVALTSLGGMAVLAWARRQGRLVAAFCGIGALGSLLLGTTLIYQAASLATRSGGHFWIETGIARAVLTILVSLMKGLGANVVVVLAAGWAVVKGWSRLTPFLRMRAGPGALDGIDEDRFLGCGFLVIAGLSLAALLVLNLHTPIIVDRYLVLCSAAAICGFALLAKDVLCDGRWGLVLLLGNAVVFLAIGDGKVIGEPRWNQSAALIGEQVAACPSTAVEAFPFPYPGSLANETKVLELAQSYLGARFGFHAHTVQAGGMPAPHDTNGCPTLFWTEHVDWSQAADGDFMVRSIAQQLTGLDLSAARVTRTHTGALLTLDPAR